MFYFDGNDYWAGWVYVWGDWQMHIPLMLNFAYRSFPLPSHPLLSGEPFRYHFVADLLSGLLMKTGLSLEYSAIIPSVFFSMFLVISVYYLFFTIFKRKLNAIVSSLLFFFNGGLGVVIYMYQLIIANNHISPLSTVIEFTKFPSYDIQWMNVWTSAFIPQRSTLLGVPLTVIILILLWKIHSEGIQRISKPLLVAAGIIAGLMPIIQIHSFFLIHLVAGFVFLISFIKNRSKILFRWLFFSIPTLIVATFIFWYFFNGIPQSNFQFRFDWNGIQGVISFIRYWIFNAGVMFFLIPYGFIKSNTQLKLFYVPFLFLFIVANIFLYQGEYMDNKFLLYWYLLSAGVAGNVLSYMISSKNNSIRLYVGIVLLYLSIISGFLDCVSLFNHDRQKYRLFSASQLQFNERVRELTDQNAVFLTAPANTWIGMTLGRPIVMTWEDWIESHGLQTDRRKNDVDNIYRNSSDSRELIRKYSIDYIIIGSIERQMYSIDETLFSNIGNMLVKNDDYTIYDVREVNKKDSTRQTVEQKTQ